MPFFIIFVVIPFLEIAVFMVVGEQIGIWTTLLLAFLTAIIGGAVVRYQGLQTLFSLRTSMQGGQMPVREIFDGACLIAAGAMLITPGFITDIAGFLLLVPPLRERLRGYVAGRFEVRSSSQTYSERQDSGVIEAEYKVVDKD